MGKSKLTQEEFINRSKKHHGEKYNYKNSLYTNQYSKIEIFCNTCKKYFKQIAKNHMNGQGCKKCGFEIISKKTRNTTEHFIKRAIEIHKDKYDYSKSIYTGTNKKIIIICKTHGEFLILPANHINKKRGCKKCGIIRQIQKTRMSLDKFVKIANNIHNNKYNYSKTKYINSKTNIIIICPDHGEFNITPNSHTASKVGCPQCAIIKQSKSRIRSSSSSFYERVIKIHSDQYLLDKMKYNGINNEITVICKKHGEFHPIANDFVHGSGCPICKESYGEKLIVLYLSKNNIKYNRQKSFASCVSPKNRKLHFDFYIESYNLLIEFDGKQHFENIELWDKPNKTNLKLRKEYDNIKNIWCKENKIELLRIIYTDINNIPEILENKIKELELCK